MSKTVYVVRHGRTAFNKKQLVQGRRINAPLDDVGIKQSEALADWFSDKTINHIFCSSLIRTRQTAEPIAKLFKLPIQEFAELDEIDFGDLEGKPTEPKSSEFYAVREIWKRGEIHHSAPNGESPIDVFKRAGTKGIELINNTNDDPVLFMIHGRLARILLSEWLGLGLVNMHKIEHTNAAINILEYDSQAFRPITLNYTGHLDALTTT